MNKKLLIVAWALLLSTTAESSISQYALRTWKFFAGITAAHYAGSGIRSITYGDYHGALPGILASGFISYLANLEPDRALIGITALGLAKAHYLACNKYDNNYDIPCMLPLALPGLLYLWDATDEKHLIDEQETIITSSLIKDDL